jgi:hypothetical protein
MLRVTVSFCIASVVLGVMVPFDIGDATKIEFVVDAETLLPRDE